MTADVHRHELGEFVIISFSIVRFWAIRYDPNVHPSAARAEIGDKLFAFEGELSPNSR